MRLKLKKALFILAIPMLAAPVYANDSLPEKLQGRWGAPEGSPVGFECPVGDYSFYPDFLTDEVDMDCTVGKVSEAEHTFSVEFICGIGDPHIPEYKEQTFLTKIKFVGKDKALFEGFPYDPETEPFELVRCGSMEDYSNQ